MIVKSLSRKSNTGQLVNYVFKYVFKEKNTTITKHEQSKGDKSKFIIRHNIRSRSVKGFIKEFKENEKYRLVHRKDSVKLYHNIISFSNKDKEHINDKLLKDIAQKFIKERGLNNMYAGTKHEDKDHIHLHLTISGTQLNGRSSRISKQQLHHIKIALDKYQREKYPQLKHSLPEHGKSKRLAKEAIVERVKTERQTDKQALIESLEKAYSTSKSQEQFLSRITNSGHQPYFRNGVFQGVRYEGKTKYRLSGLGFDKTRLQAIGQVKTNQEKTLNELRNLRAGRSTNQKRSITHIDAEKQVLATNNENEKQLQEISAIRSSDEDRDIGGGDTNENQSIVPADDESENREQEPDDNSDDNNETDDDNTQDDPSSEME